MLDLILEGGWIVDGSGNPAYWGDVGVRGDRIAVIGRLKDAPARRRLDVDGMVVCPGFVDMHSHSDIFWLAQPEALPKIRQGVTTEIIGQDGISYAPVSPANMPFWREYLAGLNGDFDLDWPWSSVGEFLDRLDEKGISLNLAYLIPHGAVRMEIMGLEKRTATWGELDRMAEMVAQGMREGAFGLSTGLYYVPAVYADTAELIALCGVVARHDGLFVTHMRDYGAQIEEAFEETCTVCRRTRVRTHISHFNTTAEIGGRLMDRARQAGLDITYDSYPYLAGCTLLAAILPPWVQEGTVDEAVERLRRPESRQRLARDLEERDIRLELVYIAGVRTPANERYTGLNVLQAAELAGQTPADFLADLLVAERLAVPAIAHHTYRTEEDFRALLRRREQIVGSDGVLVGSHPHPRGYGTFPRILGRYVRQERVLELEEAVRKMTWAAAGRVGLAQRGLLLEGWFADITCFDPVTVSDRATYAQGNLPPEGIHYVIVNGQVVLEEGEHTGVYPGRALRFRKNM
ncbi:MAG: N-acyl-D-amino-acid deacylase family protein [Anaerolineae bacterium]